MKLAVILYLAIGGAASLRLFGNLEISVNFGFSDHSETKESPHFEFDTSCRTSDGRLGECTTIMQCKRIWPLARRNFNTIYHDGCLLSHLYCCPVPTDNGDDGNDEGQVDSKCTALVKFEYETSRDWLQKPGKCKTKHECEQIWSRDVEIKTGGCNSLKLHCCPLPSNDDPDQRPEIKNSDKNNESQVDSNCTALVKFEYERSRHYLQKPGKCKTVHECKQIWSRIPWDADINFEGCESLKLHCCPIPPNDDPDQRPEIKNSDKNNEGQVDSNCTALVKTSQDPSRDYLQKPGKCKTKHDCEHIWSGRTSGPVKIGGCNSLKLLCCPLPPNDAPDQRPENDEGRGQTVGKIDYSCRSSDGKLGECKTLKGCDQTWDGLKMPPIADRELPRRSHRGCYWWGHHCCPNPPDHESGYDAKNSVHEDDSSCDAVFRTNSSESWSKPGKCKTEDKCRQIWDRAGEHVYIRSGGCKSSEHHCCPMPPADSPDRRPWLENNYGGSGSSNGEMPKQIPTNSGVNVTKTVLPRNCGQMGNEKRIFGGDQTDVGEYPWMALLEYEDHEGKVELRCGGSLITENLVLTAAHCVNDSSMRDFNWELRSVRLGEWNTSSIKDCWEIPGTAETNPGTQCTEYLTVPVKGSVTHEAFNPYSRTAHHDIALVQLDRSVEFNDFVQPICLPADKDVPPILTVAGWGKTESSSRSEVLLEANVPHADRETCVSLYARREIELRPEQVCFAGQSGKDTCVGDSGGPLMEIVNGQARIVGIVSLGFDDACGREDQPSVYTKVFDYMPWLAGKLGIVGDEPTSSEST